MSHFICMENSCNIKGEFYTLHNYTKNKIIDDKKYDIYSLIKNPDGTFKVKMYLGTQTNPKTNFIASKKDVKHQYRGYMYNEIAGMFYFIQKYPNDCAIVQKDQYGFLDTIKWYAKEEDLKIPFDFKESFNKCKNKRFAFGLITLKSETHGAHANSFIYDRYDNSIEIFEPHGEFVFPIEYKINKFYSEISTLALDHLGVDKIYLPENFCPNIGLQVRQEFELTSGGFSGFCQMWSTYWIDFRLENANNFMTRSQLMNHLLQKLDNNSNDLTSFIVEYSTYIEEFTEIIMRLSLKDQASEEEINKFIKDYEELKRLKRVLDLLKGANKILLNTQNKKNSLILINKIYELSPEISTTYGNSISRLKIAIEQDTYIQKYGPQGIRDFFNALIDLITKILNEKYPNNEPLIKTFGGKYVNEYMVNFIKAYT